RTLLPAQRVARASATRSRAVEPPLVISQIGFEFLRQEMKPHKRQYLPDYLTRGFAVMKQVKRMWRLRMIHEHDRQIASQRLTQETVKRFIQMRNFVSTCSRNKQGDIVRKIFD